MGIADYSFGTPWRDSAHNSPRRLLNAMMTVGGVAMKRNSIQRYYRTKTSTVRISLIGLVLAGCVCALGQEAATESVESSATGFEVPVAMPIDDAAEKRAIAAIRAIAASKLRTCLGAPLFFDLLRPLMRQAQRARALKEHWD